MKIKIFKNWRTALAVIFLAIFVNWQVISAATSSVDSKYDRDHYGSLSDAIVAYHKDINDIFNTYIEVIVTSDAPNTAFDEECPADNVSTYCLSKEIVPIYIDFLEGLDDHSQYALDEDDTTTNIGLVTEIASNRLQMIELEKQYASQIIDLAIATYNELQIMYPVHTEYEKLIKEFEDYNTALGKWRTEIAEWPSDFIDVSTTECK